MEPTGDCGAILELRSQRAIAGMTGSEIKHEILGLGCDMPDWATVDAINLYDEYELDRDLAKRKWMSVFASLNTNSAQDLASLYESLSIKYQKAINDEKSRREIYKLPDTPRCQAAIQSGLYWVYFCKWKCKREFPNIPVNVGFECTDVERFARVPEHPEDTEVTEFRLHLFVEFGGGEGATALRILVQNGDFDATRTHQVIIGEHCCAEAAKFVETLAGTMFECRAEECAKIMDAVQHGLCETTLIFMTG